MNPREPRVVPPHIPMMRPMYVIQMGWHRWGRDAKLAWANRLQQACEATIEECDRVVRELSRDDGGGA